ncbi:MAG: hypothetical protein QG659_513 [Patescibacteria group bacterium]|jgi:hypothetical protein|nr:hypothetical protein [Patescibacteria group bacterium]
MTSFNSRPKFNSERIRSGLDTTIKAVGALTTGCTAIFFSLSEAAERSVNQNIIPDRLSGAAIVGGFSAATILLANLARDDIEATTEL